MMKSASMHPVHVELADRDGVIGSVRDLVVIVAKQASSPEGVKAIASEFQRRANRKRPFAVLLVVSENAAMPSPEIRTSMADVFARHAEHIVAYAAVHEGSGFRAATVRAIVTGIQFLARTSYPQRVCATVAEAASWLHGTAPEQAGFSADVVDAVDALSRRYRNPTEA